MTTTYLQPGENIIWTNGTGGDIASGDVVAIGANGEALLGVANVDIADGASGSVSISGVHTLAKVSAAVMTAGETVVWDSSAGEFDDNQATPASGDVSGVAAVVVEDAGNGVTSAKIKLTGVPGTLTA